ncbi:MAG: hypothetical protein OXE99_02820 [Cellvibrionales bacterium]|nr:hypothetical protein [Cellvibrionales bacterium]
MMYRKVVNIRFSKQKSTLARLARMLNIPLMLTTLSITPSVLAEKDRLERLAKELAITEQQKERLRPILERNYQSRQAIFNQYGITFGSGQRSKHKLSRSDRKAMSEALKENRKQTHKEMAVILSPEQMAQLQQLRQRKKAEFKEKHQAN